jgi:hypothetical protein
MINRRTLHVPARHRKERNKTDAMQVTLTIRNLLNELDLASRRYKQDLNSHREQVYSSMQTAQRVIVECLKNKALHSEFSRAVQGLTEKGKKPTLRFNLSLEAMARSMGASNTKARKLASKRAGVLDLLRERGVKVHDTAKTVKKIGLEKLISERPKKKKTKAQGKLEQTRPVAPRGRNDSEASMLVRMKQSERDRLLEAKFGSMLTVVVSRVKEDDGDIQVRRIASGDHLNDWED